jgi:hypothetical protein
MVLFRLYTIVYSFRRRHYSGIENLYKRWQKNLVNGLVDKMSI